MLRPTKRGGHLRSTALVQGVADLNVDYYSYTVMSYRQYADGPLGANTSASVAYPTTPMLNDIAAIQYLYGANTSFNSGNTTYSWSPGETIFETIWDGGGIDTIDWSNQSTGAKIDLNAGSWSELGPAYWNGQSNVAETLAIAYNVTIENAIGGSGNDVITGNSADNSLTGGGGGDRLVGGPGADALDGGTGNDTLEGGSGDDRYVVDSSGDQVIEAAGSGTDAVESSVSYTLPVNGENLTLTGGGSVDGFGNALANVITGNSGSNVLNGGAGADTLTGGGGNDSYVVDSSGDQVVEASGGGTDTVNSSVTFTLAANVENLTLTGGGNVDGFGNALANVITGNSGSNVLNGGAGAGAGADAIGGGAGNDRLEGGPGYDSYFFDGN